MIASIEQAMAQEGVEGEDKPMVDISIEEFERAESEDDIEKIFDDDGKKDKKQSKKKYREIEYDPENDVTIVKRRRKRNSDWDIDDWNDDWNY